MSPESPTPRNKLLSPVRDGTAHCLPTPLDAAQAYIKNRGELMSEEERVFRDEDLARLRKKDYSLKYIKHRHALLRSRKHKRLNDWEEMFNLRDEIAERAFFNMKYEKCPEDYREPDVEKHYFVTRVVNGVEETIARSKWVYE